MPSPLGHTLAGLAYFQWTGLKGRTTVSDWKTLGWFMLFSNMPDLHYIPGVLVGEPSRFHFAYLHAFGFLAGLTALLYAILEFARVSRPGFWAAHFSTIYGLHIVMDIFSRNVTPNSGVAIFWPASIRLFTAPVHLFVDFKKRGWDQIFSAHNFWALGREALVMGALCALLLWFQRRRVVRL